MLKILVCGILGGMASEANIERVFSIMGKIVSPGRSSLDADKVEAMTFVSQNISLLGRERLVELVKTSLFPSAG